MKLDVEENFRDVINVMIKHFSKLIKNYVNISKKLQCSEIKN